MTFRLLDPVPPPADPKRLEDYEHFEHLRTSDLRQDARDALGDLWQRFESLGRVDEDFVRRFPYEYGARVWEMRVACTIARWGWPILPRSGDAGPDLLMAGPGGGTVAVEAVAPENTAGADRIEVHGRFVPADIDRRVTLRYLAGISEKRRQYKRWLDQGHIEGTAAFVIAVSGARLAGEAHWEWDRLPRIARALFGLGAPTFAVSLDEAGAIERGPREELRVLRKTRQDGRTSTLGADLFVDDAASEVSAVLCSPTSFLNSPEVSGQPPAHDFVLVHNPNAQVPLEPGWMKWGREYFVGPVDDNGSALLECRDHRTT